MLVDVCDDDGDRYRFGFNGQEKVNEWAGIGNFNEFSERGQDTRTGRFISVDPLSKRYPWNSPYAFAENRVIDGADLEGREWKSVTTGNVTKLTLTLNVINANTFYSQAQVDNFLAALKPAFEKQFSKTIDGHVYLTEIVFNTPEETKKRLSTGDNGVINLIIKNQTSGSNSSDGGNYVGETAAFVKGGSQKNTVTAYTTLKGGNLVESNISDHHSEMLSLQMAIRNTLHGFGHTGGLPHPADSRSPADVFQSDKFSEIPKEKRNVIKNNVMNTDDPLENPIMRLRYTKGRDVTNGQIEQINNTVEQEQPKLNTGSGIATPEQYTTPQK